RNTQVYVHAAATRIGFPDSRMIAMTTPSATPRTMAPTVRMSVPRSPVMIGGRNMLSTMYAQLKASLVSSMCTNMATNTAMTPTATQRHGRRTGTARMGSGRARSVAGLVVGAEVIEGYDAGWTLTSDA